jgi:hypothetical protein
MRVAIYAASRPTTGLALGKRPGRPKYSDGDRERLRTPLNTGASWHAVSIATGIP